MKIITFFWMLPAVSLCQTTTQTLSPWQTGVVTLDGTCGSVNNFVCDPTWGACCSKDGICGRSTKFCGDGCQSGFGNCNTPTAPAPGPGSVSPDGSCSGTNQYKCTGSTFGDCCSSSNFCGATTTHCGTGCQSLFGSCGAPSNISSDGSCGANGKICRGSGFGDCCSSSGFCGNSTAHCGVGCQSGFGNCTSTSNISIDGSCGANGKVCKGSSFGDCCSSSGFCGSTSGFCNTASGCQSNFGSCTGSANISTDGSCGSNGKVCTGSSFGACCSSSGFCGSTSSFCDTASGCQSGFGNCTGVANVSIDGACGKNGKTCKGSTFGDCCSSSGYCGKTTDFCDAGCQTAFGTCTSGAGAISTDGSCGKNGKTCKGSTFGDCCSSSGHCGKTSTFCDAGCQTVFGTCTSGAGTISTDGACGKNGKTCTGSTFGNCCSSSGFCGSTSTFCGVGCQKGFSSACLTTNIPSVDGTCGAKIGGLTCAGGAFDGQCCSSSGYCGTTTAHCTAGGQKGYGKCT